MKNILSAILVGALALTILVAFAACGGKDMGNELEDGMTSMMDDATGMMDDATTLMDEVSTALDDLADDLTENGNVTDESKENEGADESTTKEGLLGGDDTAKTTAAE